MIGLCCEYLSAWCKIIVQLYIFILLLIVVHCQMFLDMSKAFDKVWHKRLINKMNCFGIEGMSVKLLQNFLENGLQRVLLNHQTSSQEPVLAGVPLGSILSPLIFLIYINDLSKDLLSVQFFAGTFIFSTVQDIKHSIDQLNSDLDLISKWVHQWKMLFNNPDSQKQAQQVIFSKKTLKHLLSVVFNNVPVVQSSYQQHLSVYLDRG